MKGLKEVIAMDKDTSSRGGYITMTGNLIKEMWERVCQEGSPSRMLYGKGKETLSLFAECLWMIEYTPVTPKVELTCYACVQAVEGHALSNTGYQA